MACDRLLRKHVSMIHAHSQMSTLQRKAFNVLLSEAINSQNHFNHQTSMAIECNIPLSNLSKAINFNSNNVQYLKESIDELASIKIEWNLLKDKVPSNISFLTLRILHGPPTFFHDNTLNFSIHKIMLDLSVNPSVYGTIDLALQSKFESKYSHSLYENSTRLVNLQKNKIIDLVTFRKLLGIDEKKYSSMREFTRNVVSPAVEEVNDTAEFIVSLNNIMAGRKIVGYELSVKSNNKKIEKTAPTPMLKNSKIYEKIKYNFGDVSESIIESIFKNYSEEFILEKIDYTVKKAKKESTGYFPIPYLISALKYDYKMAAAIPTDNVKNSKDKEIDELKYEIRGFYSEVSHWQKMLEHCADPNEKTNIQNIIDQSKAKLQDALLKQKILEEKNNLL